MIVDEAGLHGKSSCCSIDHHWLTFDLMIIYHSRRKIINGLMMEHSRLQPLRAVFDVLKYCQEMQKSHQR